MLIVIQPLAWLALGILAILNFSLDYLLIVAVALVLNVSNLVGYWKCRSGIHRHQISYLYTLNCLHQMPRPRSKNSQILP